MSKRMLVSILLLPAIMLFISSAWAYNERDYINSGIYLIEKGEYHKAIMDLDRALLINPRSAIAYKYRGDALSYLQETDLAIWNYTRAIRANPQLAIAYYDRGVAWLIALFPGGAGQYDHAIADCSAYIQLAHNSVQSSGYECRGQAWQAKGEYAKAISDYTTAINKDPGSDYAYSLRATAFRETGEYDKAIADFDRVLEINPSDEYAKETRFSVFKDKWASTVKQPLPDEQKSDEPAE